LTEGHEISTHERPEQQTSFRKFNAEFGSRYMDIVFEDKKNPEF